MILLRHKLLSTCTLGTLIVCGRAFATLEPPWRGNRRNVSCIPNGEYDYVYMPKSSSGRYTGCYHVMGVPGRSEILIHAGNTCDETRGCILPGLKHGDICGPAVLSSRIALRQINDLAEKKGKLRVISWIG